MYKAATTLLFVILFQTMACTQKSPTDWQIDVQKSKVTWTTDIMGRHAGYFFFKSGNLELSPAGEPLRGSFQMDMNSIRTTDNPTEAGNRKKEAEMRLPQFFDTDKHPVATMEVKKITRIGASMNYQVEGNLTIKEFTHPMSFTATIDTKGATSHITAKVDLSHQLWDLDQKTPDKRRVDSLAAIREKLVPHVHVFLDITMNK
jgi:polyisoprenoid-binding protein YceI